MKSLNKHCLYSSALQTVETGSCSPAQARIAA
jgi:hypothetical protein